MTPETLLELQLVDTATDQLRHRLPRLPEVVAEAAAKAAVVSWDARSTRLLGQIQEHEAAIAVSEQASAEIYASASAPGGTVEDRYRAARSGGIDP